MRILIALLLLIKTAQAAPSDYAKYFAIDLEAPLPSYNELYQKYIKNNPIHDRKYEHSFLIGYTFDKIFAQTINVYGSSEQRLKTANEDVLIEMLNSVPKETWQYIGPYLHTVPGMSEKILNMPGIKETKNKFPTRIAPQLKHIKDLEFLPPHMYYVLMPEIWPDFYENKEYVIKPQKQYYPKVRFNQDVFNKIKELIPTSEFFNNAGNKVSKEDLRTTNITPNSPLTSGDVKAFANTISDVRDFGNQNNKQTLLSIANAGALLDLYEAEQGTALPINALKGAVNPCQREVQKIIVAGKYDEFLKVVSKNGFSPETWAVTCDKTIKAYRLLTSHKDKRVAVINYKNGIYDSFIKNNLNPRNQGAQFATIESIIQMYKSPVKNLFAVRKNISAINKELLKSENMILSSPYVY